MDVRTFKLIIALGMMFAAVLVIVTCVWKLVKLVARFKIEGRMEELEQLSKKANERADCDPVVVSSEEARKLRRLSILAGFDRKFAKPQKSSFGGAIVGLRHPLRFFNILPKEPQTPTRCENFLNDPMQISTSNGRIYANIFDPCSMDRVSTHSKHCSTPIYNQPKCEKVYESETSSPIRKIPKLCAVHGAKLKAGTFSPLKSPSPPPPPPPPPFAATSECLESSSRLKSQKSPMITTHCVNPTHYHHFHHHHDTNVMNPVAYASATSCIMCHLSSPMFHLHQPPGRQGLPLKQTDRTPDRSDEDNPDDDDDDLDYCLDKTSNKDFIDEGDDEILEVERKTCMELVAGTPPPPATNLRTSFVETSSGRREPIYSEARSEITVHWNGDASRNLKLRESLTVL